MHLAIHLKRQLLELIDGSRPFSAPISSGAAGIGFQNGSGRTPTGHFTIRSKHGENAPLQTCFRERLPVGLLSVEETGNRSGDAILARILTLDGQDPANTNTLARCIYIHGTAHTEKLGSPASHGCIRMSPEAIAELYELIPIGTPVLISTD